jgi:hypothetical protein
MSPLHSSFSKGHIDMRCRRGTEDEKLGHINGVIPIYDPGLGIHTHSDAECVLSEWLRCDSCRSNSHEIFVV